MTTSPATHTISVPIHCDMQRDGPPEEDFRNWLDRGFRIFCLDSLRGDYVARLTVPLAPGAATPL
ncbi:hypothetical protein IGB42_02640 [Andreprevotia sp. IGB-42]|uniref:hypothetical protein n=1 Tax=Andreprevotia sp. IGB-42 TaxID=2497473 RepID=UPI00135AAFA9|nr:hypothetical protein [Andreprevotia sp. IGB-42]KAF0812797.1 hypothetical protein IGB42_02640 [Andreprevotia sp. IGB-42]